MNFVASPQPDDSSVIKTLSSADLNHGSRDWKQCGQMLNKGPLRIPPSRRTRGLSRQTLSICPVRDGIGRNPFPASYHPLESDRWLAQDTNHESRIPIHAPLADDDRGQRLNEGASNSIGFRVSISRKHSKRNYVSVRRGAGTCISLS